MKEVVYNIRIIKAKEGKENQLAKYLYNAEVKGVMFRKVMRSFASFSKKGAKGVYIEVLGFETEYELSTYLKSEKQISYSKNVNLFSTEMVNSNMKAAPGWVNSLQNFIEKADAIEFGFRRIKKGKREKWLTQRKKFMSYVKKNKGFVFDYEMISIDDDVTAVVFGWEDKESFNKGAKTIFSSIGALFAMIKYFPKMKQIAFQVGEPL